MSQIRPSALARLDIIEIADRISRDSIQAADRFIDAVEQTLQLLVSFPFSGQLCEPSFKNSPGMRVVTVRGFRNHLIFFRPAQDGIELFRVVHGSRDLNTIFGE